MLERTDRSMAIRRHLTGLALLAFAGSVGPLHAVEEAAEPVKRPR
jgi:hypothetical protein